MKEEEKEPWRIRLARRLVKDTGYNVVRWPSPRKVKVVEETANRMGTSEFETMIDREETLNRVGEEV